MKTIVGLLVGLGVALSAQAELTTSSSTATSTNLPSGGIWATVKLATTAPKVEAIVEQPSLSKSNSVAGTDLGVGASSIVRQEIRLLEDGAVADYGLQKVFFPAEITEAPLSIITADGRKLACRATFLALHDAASGQSLLLGEVRKSIGELIGDNTVVYLNAFDILTNSEADVTYEILSKTSLANSNWISEKFVLGAEGQNGTPTDILLTKTNNKFFWARAYVDSDGD